MEKMNRVADVRVFKRLARSGDISGFSGNCKSGRDTLSWCLFWEIVEAVVKVAICCNTKSVQRNSYFCAIAPNFTVYHVCS